MYIQHNKCIHNKLELYISISIITISVNLPQATKLDEGAYAQAITQLDLRGIA